MGWPSAEMGQDFGAFSGKNRSSFLVVFIEMPLRRLDGDVK